MCLYAIIANIAKQTGSLSSFQNILHILNICVKHRIVRKIFKETIPRSHQSDKHRSGNKAIIKLNYLVIPQDRMV